MELEGGYVSFFDGDHGWSFYSRLVGLPCHIVIKKFPKEGGFIIVVLNLKSPSILGGSVKLRRTKPKIGFENGKSLKFELIV